jgi:hypothetical protein
MINVETNCGHVISDFERWGFGGYLLHLLNDDGTYRKTAGTHAGDKSQDRGMLLLMNYISLHCHREMHMDLLDDIANTRGVKDLTHHDLTAAAGLCLYGVENGYKKHLFKEKKTKNKFDVSSILFKN